MLARLRTVLALASTFAVLTACGGGSHSTLPVATPNGPGTGPQNSFRSTGFVYDAGFVAKSHLIAPAHFGTLALNVVLPMRDPSGLTAYANSVSDPKSANYRQFLTPVEIANRFAATASDQTAAAKYFAGLGLQVGGWKQRMLLRVVGTQAQLETAFRTKFGTFQSPQGLNFLAPMKTPSVPAGVPVVGSADIVVRPKRFVSTLVPATGTTAGYAPQQIARAFDYDGAYAAGYTGAGITVGIIGTGGIQTTGGGRVGDADAYKALYHIGGASTVSIVAATPSDPVVNSASGFAPPPPLTGPCITAADPGYPPSESPTPTCNPEDGEAQLDTEQTASLARDSSVQFFLAYNPNDRCANETIGNPCAPNTGNAYQGLAESDEELQTAIDNDSADVLSLSFGGDEYQTAGLPGKSPPYPFTTDGSGLDPTELMMLVAEGTAVFVASGDSGAQGCQPFASGPNPLVDLPCVSYPSTDPSAVAVGGVTTPLNAAGQFVGPVTVWGQQTSGGFESGSGGGVSAYFPQPPYQQGLPGITGQNRNVPDLSLEGDPRTGVALLRYADRSFGGAQLGVAGGTSVAAPQMAAMWALVLQACKANAACSSKGGGTHPYRLGNPNPLFYGYYQAGAPYAATFLQVSYGNNAQVPYCSSPANAGNPNCPSPAPNSTPPPPYDPGYGANPIGGYNQATGLGVPFARALIRAVVGV